MGKHYHYGYFKGVGGITLNAWIPGQENVSCASTRPSEGRVVTFLLHIVGGFQTLFNKTKSHA